MSKWIICFPRGDQRKLAIAEICNNLEYEKNDYALASRHEYFSKDDAVYQARELA